MDFIRLPLWASHELFSFFFPLSRCFLWLRHGVKLPFKRRYDFIHRIGRSSNVQESAAAVLNRLISSCFPRGVLEWEYCEICHWCRKFDFCCFRKKKKSNNKTTRGFFCFCDFLFEWYNGGWVLESGKQQRYWFRGRTMRHFKGKCLTQRTRASEGT